MNNNDKNADLVVYGDGRYTLGERASLPYLTAAGKTYKLTCHPYEPCLYITDGSGFTTAVHNSFDPSSVLERFRDGQTVTSITGFEYDALDFCRMVEYAAGMGDIQIDYAERVFGDRAKSKHPKPEKEKEKENAREYPSDGGQPYRPESGKIIEDDPFCALIEEYPDCVVDYCLVKCGQSCRGCNEHWKALASACRKLFVEDNDEVIWNYDVGKANAKPVSADVLFAPVDESGDLNYRKAFLCPPYENGYTDADFDKVNAALFPKGTDSLQVFEWTTDWSEYFDEGHEWWGALCYTVYDAALDRFVIILASATD